MILEDVPALDDWITVSEAGEILGLTKQGVHRLIANNEFKTIHAVGKRPTYVVSEKETHELHERRSVKQAAQLARRTAREEEQRQRRMARDNNVAEILGE